MDNCIMEEDNFMLDTTLEHKQVTGLIFSIDPKISIGLDGQLMECSTIYFLEYCFHACP